MNNYLEARQWLRSQISFEEFEKKLPASLVESGLLSLLVGAALEQRLEPFGKYLELLVRQGADANYCQYQMKMSLLMLACKKTKPHIIEAFLSCPNLQVYHRDNTGKNAVHYAIEHPDQEEAETIVKQLIQQFPLLKDMGNYPKGSYITLAIRQAKSSLLEMLIEEDIEPNLPSLEGLGPLHEAVRAHKTHRNKETTMDIIKLLLNAGCQEEEQNKEGLTYMNYARDKGFIHEEDIDEILDQVNRSTTPKQTTQTSPEEKLNQIFSIESGEVHHENQSESSEESSSESSERVEDEPNHEQISTQMFQWAQSNQQQHGRIWALVHPFYAKIQKIVLDYYGTIQIIGSFASQLWIPSSDVDFLIIIPEGNEAQFEDVTDILYRKISRLGCHSSIRLIRTYKLPLIKLVLTLEYQKLQVELFLSSKKNIVSRYVSYTNQVIAYCPEIAVIYFVLRKLFSLKGLHEHRKGGLKAYALFLLIYQMRSQYQYAYVSQFVEHFCYYYGFAFDYQASTNSKGDLEYHINIVDPLNSENNMGGKNTDILALKEVLKKIYLALNTPSLGSKMDYIVEILRHI